MINEYTYEEVSDSAAQYFSGDALPANVWISKYALKNSDGVLFELNPDDMHKRLSGEISRIEEKYINPLSTELIYSLLKDFKYIIPGGSSMSGIGNNLQIVSLSNCFVVGSQSDSYGGIMYVDQEQVQLMKRRGGVGHDLSHLRPKGSPVKNSALTSTGVVPFMERYSNSTREVAQDGRRGALMLCIDVKHLDSEDFIDAKLEQGKVTGANISVKISDEFMESVTNNANFTQQFPVNSDNPLFTKEVNSLTIWNKIIHNAWKSAEPGVLFWDKTISESIPDLYGKDWKTTATNPCGEIGLCPYDSCRLLSLNLYSYVDYPFTSNAKFNKELFKEHVIYAQRIMDDIIDLEIEKINTILNKIKLDPEADNIKEIEYQLWIKIKNKAELGRRTGLGITAEGDMLAALGLKYGTPEATDFAEEIQKTLAVNAYKSSIIMAKERGSFSMWNYETEKDAPFIKRIIEQLEPEYVQMFKETGRRNIALLTIAPGGTVSLMTQTTSGIEPVFLPAYKRRRKINPNDKNTTLSFIDEVGDHWEEYNVFHPKFEVWADINNYDVDKLKSMTDDELQEVIKLSPYFGATSNDVDWVEKVNMQGRIQKWIDHSISVTVNLPNNATEELVDKVYKKAWEVGCKGLTIYRDGSRSGVLISNTDKKDKVDEEEFLHHDAPKRPRELKADYYTATSNGRKFAVIVGIWKDTNKPYEIFAFENPPMDKNTKGRTIKVKKGHYRFINGEFEIENVILSAELVEQRAHTYFLSMLLRQGAGIKHINKVSKKIDDNITSFSSVCRRILSKYEDVEKVEDEQCPECGSTLIREEGCIRCSSCEFSRCGS